MDTTMRALRYHSHGEPADVLTLDQVPVPTPGPGHIAVRVQACALNPADWALCRGLPSRELPCGIGLDVAGTVVAIGEGVTGVARGDEVFGPAEFRVHPTAGAADVAILYHWEHKPAGLSPIDASALPMAVETAARYLTWSGAKKGQTLLVNGAGTMVGYALVQMALLQNIRVIATAGSTFADQLRAMGATVVAHGEGMAARVRAVAPVPPDVIVDVAPINLRAGMAGVMPELVEIAGGDAKRVITVADIEGAAKAGARTGVENVTAEGGLQLRWDVLRNYAELAAAGTFTVPVARTFPLEDWREALEISLAGKARGKLVLVPSEG
jgi:NADPH:quinone reductase-like Zn-dependent oxidoreductase